MMSTINRREALRRTALITGFAVSGSMMSAMLQGCDQEVDTTPDWTPEFFTPEEGEDIAAMAEAILPRTETPGARDAMVERYIDMITNNCMKEREQQRMREGIAELNAAFTEENEGAFRDATPEVQLNYMQLADNRARQIATDNGQLPPAKTEEERLARRPFFLDFKQLVISGYFTSQLVGTEVLVYDPIPEVYIGCGDLQELTGGRDWSL